MIGLTPLEQIKDEELVKRIKENDCSESVSELVARHAPLYHKVCKKYSYVLSAQGINMMDIYQDCAYIIYRAAMTYTSGKAKVSSWIGTYTRYYCSSLINKYQPQVETMDEVPAPDSPIYPQIDKLSDYVVDILNQLKDKRIKTIFKLRYFNKNKVTAWKDIGSVVGLCDQSVINLHDRAIQLIKYKLNSKEINDMV